MRNKINFYDGFIKDDVIWFSNLNNNALMTLDIITGELCYKDSFPDKKLYEKNLHIRVIEDNGLLYFIPQMGSCVHIYSISKESFLSSMILPYANDTLISNAFKDENGKIWIIPSYVHSDIACINCCDNSVSLINLSGHIINYDEAYIGPNCVSYNKGVISGCVFKSNQLFFIDTNTQIITTGRLSNEYAPYSFVSDDGDLYIFSDSSDKLIISWRRSDNSYNMINEECINIKVDYDYWNYIRIDDSLICLPYRMNDLLCINNSSKQVKQISINESAQRNSLNPMFSFYTEYKNRIYCFPSGSDSLMIINKENLSIRFIDYLIDDAISCMISDQCSLSLEKQIISGEISESIDYDDTLSEFLDYIVKSEHNDAFENAPLVGNAIHKYFIN